MLSKNYRTSESLRAGMHSGIQLNSGNFADAIHLLSDLGYVDILWALKDLQE
jgi:hypothetical protein